MYPTTFFTDSMTTGEFAYHLRHEVPSLKEYAEIVLDWESMTKSLYEWLIYLLNTLDQHITQLSKEVR